MAMSLSVLNAHVRDNGIRFDEQPHIYYVNDKAVNTSVTSVVHQYFPKFDSDAIIDKMMSSRWWYKSKYFGKTKQEIKEEWKQSGLEATTHGTNMHKTIEDYYNKWPLSHPETPEFDMFLQFAADHALSQKAYRTEWEVYIEEFDLAGSIDMVFWNTEDDTYSIYDWKRTKEIKLKNDFGGKGLDTMSEYDDCNYVHYSLQLNIYKYILETKYGLVIRDMFLVCMHPLYKSYKKIEVLELQDEVKIILSKRFIG